VIVKSRAAEPYLGDVEGEIIDSMTIFGIHDLEIYSDYYSNIHDKYPDGLNELGNFDDDFVTFFSGRYRFDPNTVNQIAIDFPDSPELQVVAHDLQFLQERYDGMISVVMSVFEDEFLGIQVSHRRGGSIAAIDVAAVENAFKSLMLWASNKLRIEYRELVGDEYTEYLVKDYNIYYSFTGEQQ
jgi:hypothetical protein